MKPIIPAMRAALVAIQELHVPYVTNGGSEICMRCGLSNTPALLASWQTKRWQVCDG